MGEVRLLLVEEGADAERLERLTGFLREELLQIGVESVTALRASEPPPGARAFDVATVGGLLVGLAGSAESLRSVAAAVRQWLARSGGPPRAVRLELDGDVLELSAATARDQTRLIDVFVSRHAPNE
ncbi:hypothetical protein [Frankia sp. CiP3]|uniref:hypothetical protein n=1 Tax=Frankia sp. CiP3 TaxID=2880971 RepID=UPI001EF4D2BC|nr:hypothetical protein [Frankia sp. CiP3]